MKWNCLLLSLLVQLVYMLSLPEGQAGVMSLLLSPPNAQNDALQDRSWRLELANSGSAGTVGNVMYGLSAFDTLTINGVNYNLDRSTWMVFSVTRSAATTRSFKGPFGPMYLSGNDFVPTTVSGYTLGSLLGSSSLPPTAMAALVELNISYSATTYLKQLTNDTAAGKTLIDNAIAELASKGQLLAAFGPVDSQDFYFMSSPDSLGTSLEFFGLSPVAAGSGVDLAWFRQLFNESGERIDLSKYEFSLRDFMYVSLKNVNPQPGVAALYIDRGTVLVNVVPEPSPLVSLLTTSAAGLIFTVRRGSKAAKSLWNLLGRVLVSRPIPGK
ncbi:MAG: hypothetical protein NZ899_08540 [Thermoguttaceae bacterium]|nr:hypothetical protein [Thermoguttaceae bacterium]MDW8078335.1 hypothetical protein [Thermoguttaceae bacterium]